jgi:L-threonylcarbamoyladenylate synthase
MIAEISTRVVKAGPDGAYVRDALRVLAAGGLVAFPTETVYGLGADATNGEAIARLYEAKGRPSFNPLIAHVVDTPSAERLAHFDANTAKLASAFWPGPLTLVLPKTEDCPVADLATAGLDSIGVRVPAHDVAHGIIAALGRPVVAPSANVSGHVSPTEAAHVLADLNGRIDLIVDGGPTSVGVESTIVACLGEPTLLRPGGVSRAEIERVIGRPLISHGDVAAEIGEAPLAPGMLASHYAPHAALRLNARDVRPGEALLAFGRDLPVEAASVAILLNLSHAGDPVEAAANLFSHLRALDRAGAARVAVMPIPDTGLGEAINDRLKRAAAPR